MTSVTIVAISILIDSKASRVISMIIKWTPNVSTNTTW